MSGRPLAEEQAMAQRSNDHRKGTTLISPRRLGWGEKAGP
jgi:hypothetical protein